MKENEGVWQEATSRRNQNRREDRGETQPEVMKYYVSNIPIGCIPWDVKRFLADYGDIVGTYIARKRDKEGNRFGFVSFRRVRNAVELEKRLNGIKMGPCRLKVNIAKFAAENNGRREMEASYKGNVEKNGTFMNKLKVNNVKAWQPGDGFSFRDAVDGKAKNKEPVDNRAILTAPSPAMLHLLTIMIHPPNTTLIPHTISPSTLASYQLSLSFTTISLSTPNRLTLLQLSNTFFIY
ncbi:nucleotide-binding alpha-beta plait domain-containing protein [Artemisia annua]|uniref:Nucleotide-binding alpha-beta plait domain-containing protein n=1 Tax=Artemisia annua TaxID=35608 RepID=A0A2U1NEJ0_ARTAN|nr:nucleotide-binding alpha-beta plait domain-containing protein [Artemisia annua]